MPELVVTIPTAGRPSLLRRTLESLSRCERPATYTGTIVVENGPRSGAERIARCYNVEYLHVPEANKSHALNHVLDQVGDVLLYFCDDDVRLDRNALSAIANAAGGTVSGEFFGGPVRIDYEQEPPKWMQDLLPPGVRGFDIGNESAWLRWPFFLGCNWAAFAVDLRRAGGFDVRRGPGSPTLSAGQETAMQERLRDIGVRAKRVPEALVWHWVPRDRCSSAWLLHRRYRHGIHAGLRLRDARKFGIMTGCVPWWRLMRSVPSYTWLWIRGGKRGRLKAKARLYYNVGIIAARRIGVSAGGDIQNRKP